MDRERVMTGLRLKIRGRRLRGAIVGNDNSSDKVTENRCLETEITKWNPQAQALEFSETQFLYIERKKHHLGVSANQGKKAKKRRKPQETHKLEMQMFVKVA